MRDKRSTGGDNGRRNRNRWENGDKSEYSYRFGDRNRGNVVWKVFDNRWDF
jgi:hypothetical protein